MTDLHAQTLTGAQNRSRQCVNSRRCELTQALLDRIAGHESSMRSSRCSADKALADAEGRDEQRAGQTPGAMCGLPIVHKDIFCMRDVLTTCGSRMLENFVSPYDATIVEKLSSAGAVMLGKTNMDEFAMGSSNETSLLRPRQKPVGARVFARAVPRVVGRGRGSATGIAGATATDTGGSIRQPRALTGTVGFKPTYGRVSRYGMIAFASSLDQAGHTDHALAEDAALMLGVMAGFDERDSTSIDHPVPDYIGEPRRTR